MAKTDLTVERLRELVHYDPVTGIVTSRVIRFGLVPGQKIGSITKRGYLVMGVDGRKVLVHRAIWLWMTGAFPLNGIDHINGRVNDNRWANLRDVTQAVNSQNRHVPIRGVTWHKHQKRWVARITAYRQRRIIGNFTHLEDALAAYKAAKALLLSTHR